MHKSDCATALHTVLIISLKNYIECLIYVIGVVSVNSFNTDMYVTPDEYHMHLWKQLITCKSLFQLLDVLGTVSTCLSSSYNCSVATVPQKAHTDGFDVRFVQDNFINKTVISETSPPCDKIEVY